MRDGRADVRARTKFGLTPLDVATKGGEREWEQVVALLSEHVAASDAGVR